MPPKVNIVAMEKAIALGKKSKPVNMAKPEIEEPSDENEPPMKDIVSRLGGLKGSPADRMWRHVYKGAFQDNKYEND